jgi:hypothetical protein
MSSKYFPTINFPPDKLNFSSGSLFLWGQKHKSAEIIEKQFDAQNHNWIFA